MQTNLSNPWNLLVIGNLGYYKPLQAIAIDNKLKSSRLRNLNQRWPTLNLLKGCCCCLLRDIVLSVLPVFQNNTLMTTTLEWTFETKDFSETPEELKKLHWWILKSELATLQCVQRLLLEKGVIYQFGRSVEPFALVITSLWWVTPTTILSDGDHIWWWLAWALARNCPIRPFTRLVQNICGMI